MIQILVEEMCNASQQGGEFTSNFDRVFKKTIYNRLTRYIKKHGLLYSSQYHFHKGHSTQHAILDMIVNDIYRQT